MSEVERIAKKTRLGRGLGSLLDTNGPEIDRKPATSMVLTGSANPTAIAERTTELEENRVWRIPIEKILANKKQPRKVFDGERLKELSNSIREQGVIQPILVRPMGDGYEVIAGERRWRASQLAGLKEVPAIVKKADDQKTLELALIENIQRADLNPIEEANAYEELINRFKLSHSDIAIRVGKERATVTNVLRLLTLAPELQVLVSKNEISMGHAKVLLSILDFDRQRALAQRILVERLSVRALEREALRESKVVRALSKTTEDSLDKKIVEDLQGDLQKELGTKVKLRYSGGKGEIEIHFFSKEQFDQIIDRLRGV